MPIEKRNPITEVAQKLSEYAKLHNRKLTLEYTLLNNVNDSENCAQQLANLAAFLIRTEAGGVFMIKLKLLSAYAVMTTGMGKPGSIDCVWELKPLQNSIIFNPF